MATTSMWPIHNTGSGAAKSIIKRVVEYAENEEKTIERVPVKEKPSDRDPKDTLQSVMSYVSDKNEGMKFVTGINCTAEHAVEEMMITKRRWPDRGNRILYHGYQSFKPGEVTPEQAHRIGVKLAQELWAERFEVVVATHLDREHLHNHFVVNAMSFVDGTKFIWDEEYPRMQFMSDELCREENLSVVPRNKDKEASKHIGAIQAGKRGTPTVESIVKEDVDSCIAAASSLQEWFQLMRDKGYTVDDSRKYLRVFPYGHSKCIRIDRRFGPEYSMEGIESMIISHGAVLETDMDDEKEQEEKLFDELLKTETDKGESAKDDHTTEKDKRKETGQRELVQKNIKVPTTSQKYKPLPTVLAVHRRLMLPIGIQIIYIRFIVRTGYHRTPAQIARIHYLYREELTRLDHYIREAKFLIYEDIHTEEELTARMDKEAHEISFEKKEVQRLKYRIKAHPEEESLCGPDLRTAKEKLGKAKENYGLCRNILARMETIRRKEEMTDRLQTRGKTRALSRNMEHQKRRMEEAER